MINYNELTVKEKLSLWNLGERYIFERLGERIPKILLADGPCGPKMPRNDAKYNALKPADEFRDIVSHACLHVLANSWSRETAYAAGKYIADESIEMGVDVLFAPGVNIKRTPTCGRNFEYFSEDPCLGGILAGEWIKGVQDKGVGACPKHFVANNSESDRTGVSSEIDERTLQEIYYNVFVRAFKEKPVALMTSYNLLNGIHVDENRRLLNDVLRGELGFEGITISDGLSVKDVIKSFKAGLNLMEPGLEDTVDVLMKAYNEKVISDEDVDRAIKPLIDFANNMERLLKKQKVEFTQEQRHAQTIKEAEEGIVLLKNEGILPLKDNAKIAVTGAMSDYCYVGGGSARLNSAIPVKPIQETLQEALPNSNVVFYPGYDKFFSSAYGLYMMDPFLQVAYDADYCIINVCESPDLVGENIDRMSIKLDPRMEMIIREVAKVNKNVIVNIYAGSAIDMSNWIDDVKGVVYIGYAGGGQNEALANILTGKVCPSGKLSETFPIQVEDCPAYTGEVAGNVLVYKERYFVGYRYYDSYNKPVLFPFGYGLSYAKFRYDDFNLIKNGEADYTVEFNVYNDSDVDGKEVVQLYVRDVSAWVSRPYKELKNFDKVFVKAHSSTKVALRVREDDFKYYSSALHEWVLEEGWFEIIIGASCQDVRHKFSVKIGEKRFYIH